MPSGKVHDRITLAVAGLSVPVWLAVSPSQQHLTAGAIFIGALLFSGLALSPDLDLDSLVYRRWGPFRWLWWPYQKLVRHRSWVSHSFLFGPLLRVVYFLALVFVIFRAGSWFVDLYVVPVDRNGLSRQWAHGITDWWRRYPLHGQMLLLGLFLGSALHCAADLAVSAWKRRF